MKALRHQAHFFPRLFSAEKRLSTNAAICAIFKAFSAKGNLLVPMNSRGIFCFVLLLAFFALEARFLNEAGSQETQLRKAGEIAFELEKAGFARALMENSVDSAIGQELKEGIAKNLEPKEIKESVNQRLAMLFQKMESGYSEGISVKFCHDCMDLQFLNENSSVFAGNAGKATIAAQYCFTGGIKKDKKIEAEISGKSAKLVFSMPIGYCIEATAAK